MYPCYFKSPSLYSFLVLLENHSCKTIMPAKHSKHARGENSNSSSGQSSSQPKAFYRRGFETFLREVTTGWKAQRDTVKTACGLPHSQDVSDTQVSSSF